MRLKRTILLFLTCSPLFANERIYGWCEQGNQIITVLGYQSSAATPVRASYPTCTITVYVSGGGGVLAKIYSDSNNAPLANPFRVGVVPENRGNGYWYFYAANGRYDVQFSGGEITAPFTLEDYQAFDETTVRSNVVVCGADNSGAIDSTGAIQACANAAQSNSGTVFFPAGTYRFTDILIPNGVTVQCTAQGTAKLNYAGTNIAFRPQTTAPDQQMNVYGCSINKMNAKGGVAIGMDGCQRCNVINNNLSNCSIGIDGNNNGKGGNGTYFNRIQQNRIDTYDIAISMNNSGGQTFNRNDISNNRMTTGTLGVYCPVTVCAGNFIYGNDVEGMVASPLATAYKIYGVNNTVVANWVENITGSETYVGIDASGGNKNIYIGNIMAFPIAGPGTYTDFVPNEQNPKQDFVIQPSDYSGRTAGTFQFPPMQDNTTYGITQNIDRSGLNIIGVSTTKTLGSCTVTFVSGVATTITGC